MQKEESQSQSQPYCSIFLFVNSSSGGGVGTKLIQQETQKIQFQIPIIQFSQEKKLIHVYFFNMKTKREKGFITLRKLTQKNYKTIVIVCGGDGTVVWVVSEFNKYNIDPSKAPIGIIPLGTGNDFSQYLGWGKLKTVLVQNSFLSLKKLIRKWLSAKIQDFDIWDVRAQVQDYGKLQKVQNFQNKELPQKSFSRSFCNYFSFGIDGKIGYSFDLHRTSSRMGNLAMYGTLGLLKAMTKTKLIQELIQSVTIRPQLASNMIQTQQTFQVPLKNLKSQSRQSSLQSPQKSQIKQQNNLQVTKTKFISKVNKQLLKTENNTIEIKQGYYNIVALNINSYMGGVTDIWKNAKIGLKNKASSQFKQASSSDGKLQFVSFSSSIGMAAQRTFGGFAQKVYQGGQNPIYFTFKKYDSALKHRTYLQIDGQFLRFTHPKSVLIQKSHLVKDGKIKVLRNIS